MKTLEFGSRAHKRWLAALPRSSAPRPDALRAAEAIVRAVRRGGDAALVRLTAQLDGVRLTPARLRVRPEEIRALARKAERPLVSALRRMAEQVGDFHARQLERGFRHQLADGSLLEEVVRPLDSAGLYVPGGAGAYPSSVLMNAIPAQVAGVERLDDRDAAPDARGESRGGRRDRGRRGRGARLPRGRGPGDRGARLRHEDDPGRGEDRRSRQRLRRRREAAGARPRRDRQRGRAERGRDPGRRLRRRGPRGRGPAGAGRARQRRRDRRAGDALAGAGGGSRRGSWRSGQPRSPTRRAPAARSRATAPSCWSRTSSRGSRPSTSWRRSTSS